MLPRFKYILSTSLTLFSNFVFGSELKLPRYFCYEERGTFWKIITVMLYKRHNDPLTETCTVVGRLKHFLILSSMFVHVHGTKYHIRQPCPSRIYESTCIFFRIPSRRNSVPVHFVPYGTLPLMYIVCVVVHKLRDYARSTNVVSVYIGSPLVIAAMFSEMIS
jgi:hypothetical protein